MFRKCEKCSSKTLSHEDVNVDLNFDSVSENSHTSDSDCDDNDQTAIVAFYEWACEGTKLKKILSKESVDSAIRKFISPMTALKHHIYIKRVQFNHYNRESNLGRNNTFVQCDYSEGYESKQQHEIQSAYFSHTPFSIFTACCYLRDSEDNLISESITITSELPDPSRASAVTSVSKVIETLREKHQYLPLRLSVFV